MGEERIRDVLAGFDRQSVAIRAQERLEELHSLQQGLILGDENDRTKPLNKDLWVKIRRTARHGRRIAARFSDKEYEMFFGNILGVANDLLGGTSLK